MIHICFEMGNRRPAFNAASDKRRMKANLFGFRRYISVKIRIFRLPRLMGSASFF